MNQPTHRITRRVFTLSALTAVVAATSACETSTGAPKPDHPPTSAPPSQDRIDPSAAPAPQTQPPPAGGSTAAAVQASNAFSAALLARLAETPGNFAFSPASLSMALTMTYAGARGETAAQMAEVLELPAGSDVHGSWATISAGWQVQTDGYEIATANRLFGEASYRFEPEFLALTARSYGAALEPRDFRHAPGAQRAHINRWVSDRTREHIRELLPEPSISDETRLVLVNALYLSAGWKDPFDANRTLPADFHVNGQGPVKVPTMHRTGAYRHARVDGARILEISYRGERLSMVIVLPDTRDGLAALEKSLPDAKLQEWIGRLGRDYMSVSLPRFTIDAPETTDLTGRLKEMGMRQAFERATADFTGIADPPRREDRLYIGSVFHKAFVAVDEQGTEATAATAVTMPRAGGMPSEERTFRADHPFLFFIRDSAHGGILFAGRVSDPSR